jgi:hypothetical protein
MLALPFRGDSQKYPTSRSMLEYMDIIKRNPEVHYIYAIRRQEGSNTPLLNGFVLLTGKMSI